MRYRIIITLLVLAIIAALGWRLAPLLNQSDSVVQVGQSAPDFILESDDGMVQLSEIKGGRILYFGFSHCPDVCPTGLATYSAAWNSLRAEKKEQLQGIFISLDPERDTPEQMARYTRWFNAQLLGLTADRSTIDQLAQRYGVYHQRVELPNSRMGYSIDHSAHYYLISPSGELAAIVPHGSTVKTLADAMLQLIP